MRTYSREELQRLTMESNRIEGEPVTGPSFDNHWRATMACYWAAQADELMHPQVLHYLLFQGFMSDQVPVPGAYRESGVMIRRADGSTHVFPPAEEVSDLMNDWWYCATNDHCGDCTTPNNKKSRWDFHARFESIHPFSDGNGRVGRMLWWNMTMLAGEEIELIRYIERFAYYDRLEEWRK